LFYFKDDILKIIQSNEPNTIQKYLEDYLILLRKKIGQYTSESITESTLPRLERIDSRLKEFVRLHHLDLLRTINYQISKLNSHILIEQFSKQLSSFRLTTKQVPTFV
jgi:hypothetical protein